MWCISSSKSSFFCCLFSNRSGITFTLNSPIWFMISSFPSWCSNWILLSISSWLSSFIWIVNINQIIMIGSIFPKKWLFQLLNSLILIIFSLWHKSFRMSWINLSISSRFCSFVWVIDINEIIIVSCIFPIQWLFQLLNSFVLVVFSLWN